MENQNGAATTTAEAKQEAKETAQVSPVVAKNEVAAALNKATKQGTMLGLKSNDILTVIGSMKAQIAQAVPKHLTPERMIQMAATLIAKNKQLAECTAQSLLGAVMQASILGFEPVDTLGHCYFVPYNNKVQTDQGEKWEKQVQFQIGYKGWISLARKSNEVKMIFAEVVHPGDEFQYELGLEPKLIHRPKGDNLDKPITHVYAVVHYKDGGYNFVVLAKTQVEKLRLRSPMQKADASGAWKTDYEAMARAKAIKQLAKYMPLSIEFQKQALADEAIINDRAFSNNNTGLQEEKFEYAEVVTDTTEGEPTNE